MKIAITSDVHLEFGPLTLENKDNVDVLVLSGDICVAKKYNAKDNEFFHRVSQEFPNVIYLMGNHEHYDGDFATTESTIREQIERFTNIHFLERNLVTIDDVTFVGGTMWSDMNKRDAITMYHVGRRMNDFQIVKNSNRVVNYKATDYKKNEDGSYAKDEKGNLIEIGESFHTREAYFSPDDAADEFDKFYQYLQTVIEGKFDQKFVVCTHHAPSRQSTHPRYKHEQLMNGAYSSELDEYILDHPQIKLWTHGHTHEDFDYMIGTTRVVCNPRGYDGYEIRASRFELKFVEI